MKVYIKRAVSLTAAALITLLLVLIINDTLIMKRYNGITPMKSMYAQEKDSIDVLCIGSSHIGINLDVAQLWKDYGIAAFNLWSASQAFWNTYYDLREVYKTQSPAVVVIEMRSIYSMDEYNDDRSQTMSTLGMKFNLNRLKAVTVTAPKEKWLSLFFGLPVYHTRYSELTAEDFDYYPWNGDLVYDKGGSVRYGYGEEVSYNDADREAITEKAQLMDKQVYWLSKCIEICQKNGSEVVLLKTSDTYAFRIYGQKFFNAAADLADEYGVPFINCNAMDEELGITYRDYWTDGHLNTSGARKTAAWLGGWMKEQYDIPDRRGDAAYESWDVFAENMDREYVTVITEKTAYLEEIEAQGLALEETDGEGVTTLTVTDPDTGELIDQVLIYEDEPEQLIRGDGEEETEWITEAS